VGISDSPPEFAGRTHTDTDTEAENENDNPCQELAESDIPIANQTTDGWLSQTGFALENVSSSVISSQS
jgi:hypothetical protein